MEPILLLSRAIEQAGLVGVDFGFALDVAATRN